MLLGHSGAVSLGPHLLQRPAQSHEAGAQRPHRLLVHCSRMAGSSLRQKQCFGLLGQSEGVGQRRKATRQLGCELGRGLLGGPRPLRRRSERSSPFAEEKERADRYWKARLAADPAQRVAWNEAFAVYRAWFVGG